MLQRLLIFITIALSLPGLAADDPDIRQLMTAQEFKAAGLDNLSTEQIVALNRWLVRYTAQDAKAVMKTSPAVKKTAEATISSRIDGQFNGWNGKTRFRLQNGQVWETRYDRRYRYSSMNPEVEITKNMLGFHSLKVVETGRSIGVKRIK